MLNLPTFEQLEAAVEDGSVLSDSIHTESGTYRIYNYSKSTQHERNWNDITCVARGLIMCVESQEVIALPLGKFYNYLEPLAHDGTLAGIKDGPYEIYDKLDGSLGICYRADGKIKWATRGSFRSTQSLVAQTLWEEKYAHNDTVLLGSLNYLTLMVEIIHPHTRIVCDYLGQEDLVLLAARDRFTGEDLSHDRLDSLARLIGMPMAVRFEHSDIEALLERAKTLRSSQEGFVLKWPCGYRLKIKGDEYRRIHRLLSGCSPKQIAIDWCDGKAEAVIASLPEEFRADAEGWCGELKTNLFSLIAESESIYAKKPEGDQKTYALWVKQQPTRLQALLFLRHGRNNVVDWERVALQQRTIVRDEFIESKRD